MSFKLISNEIKNSGRIYGLDVLRALAVCIVVYEHGNFILDLASPTLASIKIIDGVDLFFVLSGFLIGGILLRGMSETESIDFSFVKKFLVRRWFRTLPNYFLFLFINILLIAIGISNGYLNRYLLTFFVFMQNFVKPYDFLFWESWSLSVEEWFYLLFPLLLFTTAFIFKKNKKLLFVFCTFILVAFSTAIRFYKAGKSTYDYETWDLWIRKLVICRFDGIGFGLLAAWLHFYYNSLWIKSKWICSVIGIVLLYFIINNEFDQHKFFTETSYFTVSAIAVMFLLPFAEQTKKYSTIFGKVVTFISLISYALYLTNLSVTGSYIRNNLNYPAHPVLMYFFYWGFSILFAAFVYAYYEKPFTNRRDRFT